MPYPLLTQIAASGAGPVTTSTTIVTIVFTSSPPVSSPSATNSPNEGILRLKIGLGLGIPVTILLSALGTYFWVVAMKKKHGAKTKTVEQHSDTNEVIPKRRHERQELRGEEIAQEIESRDLTYEV